MIHLKITRPSSLLSVEIDRDIDERQLSIIKLVLASDMTYAEALGVFGAWFDRPETFTYTLRPALERREGIDQFQAEDR